MPRRFIVGDAGGTSTQWRVVHGKDVKSFETMGYNAYTHDLSDFKISIRQSLGAELNAGCPVYLYAAGVDTIEQKYEVEKDLKELFGKDFTAENDLVGAARALCGKKAGNVCILGTGANACFYDGNNVNTVSTSLGYVLGDEGSGAYLGKKLLMAVFRKQIDPIIIKKFDNEFDLDSHTVIQQIYHKPKPNHYLAHFTYFIAKHKAHPDIYQLIYEAFEDFYHAFFFKNEYANHPFYFSGSIAFLFCDILKKVGKEKGFQIKKIIESPISGLVLYHHKMG